MSGAGNICMTGLLFANEILAVPADADQHGSGSLWSQKIAHAIIAPQLSIHKIATTQHFSLGSAGTTRYVTAHAWCTMVPCRTLHHSVKLLIHLLTIGVTQ